MSLALGRLKQEEHVFEASLGHKVGPCLKEKKKENRRQGKKRDKRKIKDLYLQPHKYKRQAKQNRKNCTPQLSHLL